MARRTVAIHTGGVGDFILTCPALKRLTADGPLELAGHKERLELAVRAGIAERAHALESIAFDSLFGDSRPPLRNFLQRFDRALVWMRDDGAIEDGLRRLGIADVMVRPGLPPDGWNRHASAYFLESISPHITDVDEESATEVRLDIARDARVRVEVALHPGSGGARKNWPMPMYAELARLLTAHGRRVVWSRGPAEEGITLPKDSQQIGPQPLSDLAAVLAGARLYVGNDSGITHLAAAVGCPTIAIFGPTNPAVWAPRGPHVRVVQGQPWPSAHEVWTAAEDFMEAR